jgi:hypothetical protein
LSAMISPCLESSMAGRDDTESWALERLLRGKRPMSTTGLFLSCGMAAVALSALRDDFVAMSASTVATQGVIHDRALLT